MKKIWILIITVLSLSACSSSVPSLVNEQSLQGDWKITYIKDGPVIAHSPAEISFIDNNKVVGNASCNRIMASYQLDADKKSLSFGQNASTMMMCPPILMDQELKLFSAMAEVTNARFEEGFLILTDQNMRMIIKAKRK
jgi:heat shock protein HslJ